jgi:hypothetical protein
VETGCSTSRRCTSSIVTQRDIDAYTELGEKEFKKDCMNPGEIMGDLIKSLDVLGKDLLKKGCDDKVQQIKNMSGTSQETQAQNSTGMPIT